MGCLHGFGRSGVVQPQRWRSELQSNQESLDQGPVQLRERLSHGRTSARQDKGDMDASAGCMVGYTFDHGISLEAGYHFGLGDLMVTKQTTIVGLTPPTGCNQSILNWAMLSVRWANSILSSLLSAFLAAVSRSSHRKQSLPVRLQIQVPWWLERWWRPGASEHRWASGLWLQPYQWYSGLFGKWCSSSHLHIQRVGCVFPCILSVQQLSTKNVGAELEAGASGLGMFGEGLH